ncbi:MAG: hypothetical protein OQK75_06455 [Gammaproteobacteria bacterium]|nr:hypothetical protein [Gammaproteobacteria bacterium]MCW8987298.1 hypothetical protein [Gammaproteobacteria bacterium]MCW9030567.1 hypothetical protein [Gammaproteobacteria bacterium]
MAALEEESVKQNIIPFTEFLAQLVDDGITGKAYTYLIKLLHIMEI